MKKIILCLLALWGTFAGLAQYKPGYYDKMEGKQREALKVAAKECVSEHMRLGYTDLPVYWQYTDIYPDLVNGSRRWWDMYSNNIYLIRSNQTPNSSFSANRMQREHSIPKSWWKKDGDVEYTPAYTDLWNLYPSDGSANQAKSNYPFGITDAPSFNNGLSKVGPAKTGYGGGSGRVFEPGDEYKGDFARSIFYMAVVYDDLDWVYPYMFRKQSYPTLQPWAYEMLLQWSRLDPVDQKEIDRNNGVDSQQGNRNPFIDFPELAEYIWGTRTSEVFRISEQGGNITPPITGEPTIIRPFNGMALSFGETAVGSVNPRGLEIDASNLTSPLTLRITGTNRNQFSIEKTTISAAEINSTDVYTVQVFYQPTSLGTHEATLQLYDGGLALGKDVAVKLQGQALAVPTLTQLTATEATNISENEYTANWDPAPEVVDYYVLTRVRYTDEGPQASTLVAETNSLVIEDCDPNVKESYSVQSSRLGYLSASSNSITVDTNNSVIGVNIDLPLAIGTVPGGFIVLTDSPCKSLRVFDLTGTLVLSRENVPGGEFIALPAGVYIISGGDYSVPLKTLIR
ncbi:MAG: endonuclease [Prevotella sp.]|nr:endonuclease [Bacteroides sp.]MCM1366382.1 endonuclease [Prevotella sp.]MCM1436689.1 endonuclease [Prevotella sp.]